MGFLSFIVAAELVLGLVLSGGGHWSVSNYLGKSNIFRHFLADEVETIAPQEPDSSKQTAPADVNPEQAAPGESAPPGDVGAPQTSPEEQPPAETIPAESQSGENQLPQGVEGMPEEGQPPSEPTPQTEEVSVSGELSNAVSADEEAVKAETFSPDEEKQLSDAGSFTNPENIAEPVIEKAATEEEQLAQAATPAEKTALLINFADQKSEDVSNLTEANDFTSADFIVQRFNDQLDQALDNIGALPEDAAASLKEEITAMAEKAEPIFRAEQLVVPEELEQDLEITRGKFLNIESIK